MNRCLMLIIYLLFISASLTASDKVALIIAISEYAPGSGWESLGAHNDVELLTYALLQQGFEEKDILVIRNSDATKKGIVNAIEKALLKKVRPGGMALFPLFRPRPANCGPRRR